MRRIGIVALLWLVSAVPARAGGSVVFVDWSMRGGEEEETASSSRPTAEVSLVGWKDRIPSPVLVGAERRAFATIALAWNRRSPWAEAVIEGEADSIGRRAWIFEATSGGETSAEILQQCLWAPPTRATPAGGPAFLAAYADSLARLRSFLVAPRSAPLPAGFFEAIRRRAESADPDGAVLDSLDHLYILAVLRDSLRRGEETAARRAVESLASLGDEPAVALDRGLLRLSLGDAEAARRDLLLASRAEPDVETLLALAEASARAGRRDEARDALAAARLVAARRVDPEARLSAGLEIDAARAALGL